MTSERRYHPMLDGYPGREEAEERELEALESSQEPRSASQVLLEGVDKVIAAMEYPTRLHSIQGMGSGATRSLRGSSH